MDLKQKIISTAYDLFAEKGYEKTTVSEIIELVGSSKGGFYHHFKSKDEILEAITMNYINKLKLNYEEIFRDTDLTVIESINLVFLKISRYKVDQIEEWPKMKTLFSFKGNHMILRKLADRFEEMTIECYMKLFTKGKEERVFDVQYPKLLAGLWTREVMMIFNKSREVIYAENTDVLQEFEDLLDFTETLLVQTLGLKNYLIKIKEPALDYVHSAINERKGEE
ncbi:TetR/AcrR family transcriptional regulator [Chengkuizengella axinellae]|uniref:TetR/AcrR family transcriptional regulator n=1 Tax=Chengkuizengella axinellae TaxID=3064388 RepID=A0ABT9J1F0_9BACL|nr:TetR/AcrR family transcriptional regulator [Chengkuizengella sp. 2205SS18-9]MDP5275440.1 TetR/AcrR family transcriptional regulator [Chengkuizengella sp. 2205SS18-9]